MILSETSSVFSSSSAELPAISSSSAETPAFSSSSTDSSEPYVKPDPSLSPDQIKDVLFSPQKFTSVAHATAWVAAATHREGCADDLNKLRSKINHSHVEGRHAGQPSAFHIFCRCSRFATKKGPTCDLQVWLRRSKNDDNYTLKNNGLVAHSATCVSKVKERTDFGCIPMIEVSLIVVCVGLCLCVCVYISIYGWLFEFHSANYWFSFVIHIVAVDWNCASGRRTDQQVFC